MLPHIASPFLPWHVLTRPISTPYPCMHSFTDLKAVPEHPTSRLHRGAACNSVQDKLVALSRAVPPAEEARRAVQPSPLQASAPSDRSPENIILSEGVCVWGVRRSLDELTCILLVRTFMVVFLI